MILALVLGLAAAALGLAALPADAIRWTPLERALSQRRVGLALLGTTLILAMAVGLLLTRI